MFRILCCLSLARDNGARVGMLPWRGVEWEAIVRTSVSKKDRWLATAVDTFVTHFERSSLAQSASEAFCRAVDGSRPIHVLFAIRD